MIILFGGASGPAHKAVIDTIPDRIGTGGLYGPGNWVRPWLPYWALDNDAYPNRNDPGWWERSGEAEWFKLIDKAARYVRRDEPLFAVLPDVVYDWNRTVERAYKYLPELSARGIPAALALQDGCNNETEYVKVSALDVPAVFVGGSTRWKWSNIEPIRERFWKEFVHVGRVNGPRQFRECLRVGVDCVDGTGMLRYSRQMIGRVIRALDGDYVGKYESKQEGLGF